MTALQIADLAAILIVLLFVLRGSRQGFLLAGFTLGRWVGPIFVCAFLILPFKEFVELKTGWSSVRSAWASTLLIILSSFVLFTLAQRALLQFQAKSEKNPILLSRFFGGICGGAHSLLVIALLSLSYQFLFSNSARVPSLRNSLSFRVTARALAVIEGLAGGETVSEWSLSPDEVDLMGQRFEASARRFLHLEERTD